MHTPLMHDPFVLECKCVSRSCECRGYCEHRNQKNNSNDKIYVSFQMFDNNSTVNDQSIYVCVYLSEYMDMHVY